MGKVSKLERLDKAIMRLNILYILIEQMIDVIKLIESNDMRN